MLPIDPDNIFSRHNDKKQNYNHRFDKTSQDSSDTDSDNSIITTLTPTTTKNHQKIIIEEIGKKKKFPRFAEIVKTGSFEPERHFYPRVLNATIHPLVASFFQLGNERIIARYTHLNPRVSLNTLTDLLSRYKPKHFRWAGSDLFNVTTVNGQRQMIIVETNSCPSGQKSMPLLSDTDEYGGYQVVIESAFKEAIEKADPSLGDLAVICDKNLMETSGYATALAEVMQEKVWFVQYYDDDDDPPVKWIDRVMYIRDINNACFRYVTQRPWNRIPLSTRTIVMNEIVSCLAGGRNKMMADRAYEFFNAELVDTGLAIRVPETINNVTRSEIPLWIHSMGGVYTITNPQELQEFLDKDHHYDKFIVQSLVGNASWSSVTRSGKFYHVGTIPNKRNHTYVSDLRMMITAGKNGFQPVSIYARRARKPLLSHLEDDPSITSWEMLGTNLSVKKADGEWSSESERLLLMDRKDFNQLGIGVDDLIDAYVQTCLAVIAIDKMCQKLMPEEGKFDFNLFRALNPDETLLSEILEALNPDETLLSEILE
ncbi:11048_t:CDS:2 [Entrophospora sp. SA101]|nr:11048_t:CDS:2 [Entrophospora sp. SA101]